MIKLNALTNKRHCSIEIGHVNYICYIMKILQEDHFVTARIRDRNSIYIKFFTLIDDDRREECAFTLPNDDRERNYYIGYLDYLEDAGTITFSTRCYQEGSNTCRDGISGLRVVNGEKSAYVTLRNVSNERDWDEKVGEFTHLSEWLKLDGSLAIVVEFACCASFVDNELYVFEQTSVLRRPELLDISLLLNGREIKANKMLLCCHSSVFSNMLTNKSGQVKGQYEVKQFDFEVLNELVRAIHVGRIRCDKNRDFYEKLWKLAFFYDVKFVMAQLDDFKDATATITNAIKRKKVEEIVVLE